MFAFLEIITDDYYVAIENLNKWNLTVHKKVSVHEFTLLKW